MLRKTVRPIAIDPFKKKKTEYKAIVEEVRNEGQQNFSAAGRTDSATRIQKQGVKIPKPPRTGNK